MTPIHRAFERWFPKPIAAAALYATYALLLLSVIVLEGRDNATIIYIDIRQ